MMFELESFFTLGAFELAKHRALVVTYHVPLETVHVGERLVAYLTRLLVVKENKKKQNMCVIECVCTCIFIDTNNRK